ncbi:MAG: hypothetical protein ABL974_21720 [Prosthecobacter sp.]
MTATDAFASPRFFLSRHDAHNRLTATQDAAGIVNRFEYDAAGNRKKVIDGLGQETTFVYDLLNRLTSQSFANGDTWTHRYNTLHKTGQTSPRGVIMKGVKGVR